MSEVQVEDTAYLMSAGRSRHEELSRDVIAKYLVPESGQKLFDHYVQSVHISESWLGSVRHRYFIDSIEDFFSNRPGAKLINIASGFSTYPFLLSEKHDYFEFDCSKVIYAKKIQLQKLEEQGLIKKRAVTYSVGDLNLDLNRLFKNIDLWLNGSVSFALLEGILCYIPQTTTNQLFEKLADTQVSGSLIGLSYWKKDRRSHPAFQKFMQFLQKEFGVNLDYQFQSQSYFEKLDAYKIVDHRDQAQIAMDLGLKQLPGFLGVGDETNVLLMRK